MKCSTGVAEAMCATRYTMAVGGVISLQYTLVESKTEDELESFSTSLQETLMSEIRKLPECEYLPHIECVGNV